MARYFDVVLNVPINQTFTYRENDISASLKTEQLFGRRVEVRFGNRKLTGFITAVYDSLPATCKVSEEKIRPVEKIVDDESLLTEQLLGIARWVSRYYIAPIGECVLTMIPSGRRETETPGFSFQEDEEAFVKRKLSEEQKTAVDGILEGLTNVRKQDNERLTNGSQKLTYGSPENCTFLNQSVPENAENQLLDDKLTNGRMQNSSKLTDGSTQLTNVRMPQNDRLTNGSQNNQPIKHNNFHYLYGMTGSGKTEVFLTAAEKVLDSGKGVIYLVPEIGLTPQVVEAVMKRFGNTAAVLHSGLTPSQKLKEWKRILHREARVVVGARSAVFAPVPDLGLIIIDEEHDSSYKSGSSPRYHARQVAMYRAGSEKCPLVMGSATPSVEAYHLMQTGVLKKHTLTQRLAGGKMPEIRAVNLSIPGAADGCISNDLYKEINSTLSQKKQVILFLNRRGFTHFFRCNSCGYEMKCKNCSVAMTFHKNEKKLRCHYCGYSATPPQQCPECGSLDIGYSGFGTEFIEAEVKAKFPNARVLRIDTDSLTHKGELQEKIDSFRNGEYDILLGTQMVAKGLNFPKLQLVGVVLADTALHLPDFRASERCFSLITQVAGRAGRFFPDGKVLVQSYSPDREPIDFAVKNKTDDFYKNELSIRELLGFPPFVRLLRLVFRSQNKNSTELACNGAYNILKHSCPSTVQILGPAECPLEKINNNYRMQLLLRGQNISEMQKMTSSFIWGYKAPNDVYIEVDVDPVSLL